MAKQIVKSLSMLTLVVGLALAAGVKSANGQITSHGVTAVIPFDFIVGDKTLPAGRYIVSSATSDGTALRIQNRNAKPSAFRFSNVIGQRSQKQKARMVFHHYGQQYFLAQIWTADGYGRELRRSKLEPKPQPELASLPQATYQVVEIATLR